MSHIHTSLTLLFEPYIYVAADLPPPPGGGGWRGRKQAINQQRGIHPFVLRLGGWRKRERGKRKNEGGGAGVDIEREREREGG